MEHVRVFVEEGADGDIESKNVSPAGHDVERHERTALASRHEIMEVENKVEFFEVAH